MRRSRGRAVAIRAATEADRRSILARTVELDVIPHLLLLKRPVRATPAITPAQVGELAEIALGRHALTTSGFIAEVRAGGVAAEAIYLDLLTPVARRLGVWWEEDVCDFTEVTMGLWRLQSAMRDLSPAFVGTQAALGGTRSRALLVPLPGEQHTFGLSMVHDFFRRAGWDAWSGPVADRAELGAMVRHRWVDVVGFSLACDERMATARTEIAAVRRASRNPGLVVMVGGPPFVADPGLAAAIGADGTAENGLQATAAAAALVAHAGARL